MRNIDNWPSSFSLKSLIVYLCLSLVFAVSIALPKAASAETVGIIIPHDTCHYDTLHNSFEKLVAQRGLSGRVKFIVQRPYSDPVAFSNASRKLIAADVDLIITYGAAPTLALLRERTKTPHMYAGVYESISDTFKSKRIAGACSKVNVSSLVRYLRTTTKIKDLGVIYNSLEEDSNYQFKELTTIADRYDIEPRGMDLRNVSKIPKLLTDTPSDAFVITQSCSAAASLPSIMRSAVKRKIPTASLIYEDEHIPMITLVADLDDQARILADMFAGFMDGKPITSLGTECSRKVELIYNVKASNDIGLKMSMELVTEATRLINK